jgi:putative transcriptional regulator
MKCLFAFLVIVLASAAHAQPAGKPLLLVASPALEGFYSQTALIAVPAGGRHLGFILNRATEVKLASLYPDHAPSAKVADPVYLGGPEGADALFAVVRRNPGAESIRLFGDIFLVASADAVDQVIERSANDARYYAGFVAWEQNELAKEIEAGYWYVADADPALFFRRDNGALWQELVERLGNGHPPQRTQGRMYSVRLAPAPAR